MAEIQRTEELAKAIEETVRGWGAITIIRLRRKMIALGIRTEALYRSFKLSIEKGSDGFPVSVTLGFLYHGRFVDMGVGKHVKLEDVKNNAAKWRAKSRSKRSARPRVPKKFYSTTMFSEAQQLGVILLREYGIGATSIVENNLKMTVKINLT